MPRYKAVIEYDGSDFQGFQYQKNLPTIQNSLEEAIFKLLKEKVTIYAAGRTDSGVHALGQVVHFDIIKNNFTEYQLWNGINHYLRPNLIIILKIERVTEEFHARFSAKKRYYRYVILNRITPSVLGNKRLFHVRKELNTENMQKASNYLIGTHDYTSFRSKQCQSPSPIKSIADIKITRKNQIIYIDISAISFLHHMVRNIVGSLVFVGIDKWQAEKIDEIIKAKNRALAAPTAPAHGLYFMMVDY